MTTENQIAEKSEASKRVRLETIEMLAKAISAELHPDDPKPCDQCYVSARTIHACMPIIVTSSRF